MSSSPYWLPVKTKPTSLSDEVKYALAKKYFDNDGTLSGAISLNESDIPYLDGLRDAGNESMKKGALILINAIKRFDNIRFFIGE